MSDDFRQLGEDLKSFKNPPNVFEVLTESLTGASEHIKAFGAMNSIKEIKKECGLWRILPYWMIPQKVRAKSILKLSIERNK